MSDPAADLVGSGLAIAALLEAKVLAGIPPLETQIASLTVDIHSIGSVGAVVVVIEVDSSHAGIFFLPLRPLLPVRLWPVREVSESSCSLTRDVAASAAAVFASFLNCLDLRCCCFFVWQLNTFFSAFSLVTSASFVLRLASPLFFQQGLPCLRRGLPSRAPLPRLLCVLQWLA